MNLKQDLRYTLRKVLKQLSHERREYAASQLIAQLSEDSHFLSSDKVMIYYAMATEVSTEAVLEQWGDEKTFFFPTLVDGKIQVCPYEGKARMKEGQFGIWEPTTAPLSDLSTLDSILVPGVGFDSQGHRLGHGRAYYDSFLSQRSLQNVHCVGVAFSEQVLSEIPTEPHDIALHSLIIV